MLHINSCRDMVIRELLSCSPPGKLILIFALGPAVLKLLGFKVGKYRDLQGKFLKTQIEGRNVAVFSSLSKRQLLAKSGFYGVLQQHIRIFLSEVEAVQAGATTLTQSAAPLSELIKQYVFPKTLSEVRELAEYVVQYALPGRDPSRHIISLDTETNTLYPHRKKLKILNFIVTWGNGLSAAIPMEHSECPWTFEEVFPYIQQILACDKPKILQNAKYDLRVLMARGFTVNRIAWDTMLAEHLLAEDKRGFYGLKPMTATWLPRYAGYEDDLEDIKHAAAVEQEKNLKAQQRAGEVVVELKGAAKKLAEDDGYATIPLKPLNEYGAVDGDVTRRMCVIQRRRIEEENILLAKARATLSKSLFYAPAAKAPSNRKDPLFTLMSTRLIPAIETLAEMETHGMAVDREYTLRLSDQMDEAIVISKAKLLQMVPLHSFPDGFNPASVKQLLHLFFTVGYIHPKTRQPVTYKDVIPEEKLTYTETGQISINAGTLKLLKNSYDCAFAKELLQYRAVSKARNTFIANILALSEEDGRMHTTFAISGTATGRLSSQGENMQNIPLKIGKYNIKRIFVPADPSNVIVNADAKAAEVRIYAAYSQDPALVKALNDGMDPHSFFASMVYNVEAVLSGIAAHREKEVLATIGIDKEHAWDYADFQKRGVFLGTKKEPGTNPQYGERLEKLRKHIKRVVFGILYGSSKYGIANTIGITDEQAQALINMLFKMFPTIPEYIKLTEHQVEKLGVVETFIGRRRRFELSGMTGYMRSKAKRQAVNFKIQSTASDIVIDVLCALRGPLRDIQGKLLITVHDSVVFEIPPKYLSQVPDMIQRYGVDRVAKRYPWLPVPFSWDIEVGPSYGDLQDIHAYLRGTTGQTPAFDLEEHEIRQDFATLAEKAV